jgi:hypothetical protein
MLRDAAHEMPLGARCIAFHPLPPRLQLTDSVTWEFDDDIQLCQVGMRVGVRSQMHAQQVFTCTLGDWVQHLTCCASQKHRQVKGHRLAG